MASSSSAAVLDSGAVSSSSAVSSNSVIAIPDFDAPASSSSVVPVSNVAEAKTAPVVPSVTIEQVQALQTLEETEALYDAFSAEVDKNFKRVDTTEFSKFYPQA